MSKLLNDTPRLLSWPSRAALMAGTGIAIFLVGNLTVFKDTIAGRCCEGIGLGLFCSTIVALFLERLVHASILNQMKKAFEHFRDSAEVLKGSTRLGIRDVVARRDEKLRDKCDQDILEALTHELLAKSGEISICCVAGPDYLGSATAVGRLLLKHLTTPGNTCRLRVLFLDPEGQWSSVRQSLEDGHFVRNDIDKASYFLRTLQRAVIKTDESRRISPKKHSARAHAFDADPVHPDLQTTHRVQFQFYDIPPISFLMITNDLLFQETYPLAKVKPEDGPIGGRTPLLIFDNECDSYKMWRCHFQCIWEQWSRASSHRQTSTDASVVNGEHELLTPIVGTLN